jgi:BirA family biotin operon repressor/biotin-[acetyl-CoA-carboxylase] ligase
VVGVGINVSLTPAELPVPTATSLLIEGARLLDRDPLLRALLRALGRRYVAWRAAGGNVGALNAGGDGTRAAYVRACSTLGRTVRVELPGGAVARGRARDIDPDGRLVLDSSGTDDVCDPFVVASGDVLHVR